MDMLWHVSCFRPADLASQFENASYVVHDSCPSPCSITKHRCLSACVNTNYIDSCLATRIGNDLYAHEQVPGKRAIEVSRRAGVGVSKKLET